MRIGMDVWPGYEPLFLAKHQSYLPESDFRLVEFSNSSGVGRAFRNGALEAACLTLDEVFYTLQDGMDPVILLVLDESRGADVLLAKKEIRSLGDLKGKRIGVEVSAVETFLLTRALQRGGLTVKDVTLVYRPFEEHLQLFQSGAVDAVVTFEPMRTKLLEAGGVDLFNSSMIPGEIVDVLVVRRDYLEKFPKRCVNLREAWFKALEQIGRTPHESAQIMGLREKATGKEFEASLKLIHLQDLKDNRRLLEGAHPSLRDPAEQLKAIMKSSGLLQKDISLDPLLSLPESIVQQPRKPE